MGNPPIRTADERSTGVQLNDYQLRLPGFEGPLDVLLRLIEREELPIAELSLVQVTDQFLAAMRSLGREAPPALLADFATVGTRLTLIKSRALLPRPPAIDDEPEPGDLVQQLLRYRAIRDAAGHLGRRDVVDHGVFASVGRPIARGADPSVSRLTEYAPGILARAIRRRLSQIAQPSQVFPPVRMMSLHEMVVRLASQLGTGGGVRFSAVTASCQNRLEVQTAFLAGLVLIRRGMAEAEQPELFSEITFRATTAPGGDYLAGLSGDITAGFAAAPVAPDGPRPLATGRLTG
jgi:segregation and condensation protein A